MLFLNVEESLLLVLFSFITVMEYLSNSKLNKIYQNLNTLKSDIKLIYYRLGLLEKK